MADRGLTLLLGWHGSSPRQLRGLARWYETRGWETKIVVTPTFRTMGMPGAWPAFGKRLAREIGGRSTTIHAFSNAGFWTMSALLDASARAPERVVIDSAPGFPESIPASYTARYATAAMMPSLLASLGRQPRVFHPVLTPPIWAFFGAWHHVAREQVRFMETGQQRVIDKLAGVPLLAVWSDADTLVPAEHVVAFLDRAERTGIPVERLHFDESAHVRHFVQHRAEYFARLGAFLG